VVFAVACALLFDRGMRSSRIRSAHGFSLIELLVVIGITGVLVAMAALQIDAARPSMIGDGGMRSVLGQMHMARERAITERRFMRVVFTPGNLVEIVREEIPAPNTTTVSSRVMEGTVEYRLLDGLPDTPDLFGRHGEIDFGSATNIKFTPDGRMVDQNGNQINGTVFLAMASQPRSARAITVLGSTGRIRAYRWDGRHWQLV
jgi:prepilin-type N-terminal cleavage/methylation domain-containing protein